MDEETQEFCEMMEQFYSSLIIYWFLKENVDFLRLGTMLTQHLVCRLLFKKLQPMHLFHVYLLRIYYELGAVLIDEYRVVNEGDEEKDILP